MCIRTRGRAARLRDDHLDHLHHRRVALATGVSVAVGLAPLRVLARLEHRTCVLTRSAPGSKLRSAPARCPTAPPPGDQRTPDRWYSACIAGSDGTASATTTASPARASGMAQGGGRWPRRAAPSPRGRRDLSRSAKSRPSCRATARARSRSSTAPSPPGASRSFWECRVATRPGPQRPPPLGEPGVDQDFPEPPPTLMDREVSARTRLDHGRRRRRLRHRRRPFFVASCGHAGRKPLTLDVVRVQAVGDRVHRTG